MSFAATWVDLGIIILSKVTERHVSYEVINIWNLIKMIQKYFQNRNRVKDFKTKV